jgi:tryptophanyl-tRNA synthetase
MRILSGIQSSGKLHIGNYFGAIRQFVEMQDQGEALFFIADLHALTTVRDGARLDQLSLDVALDFLALGLDPAKAALFRQSDIPEVTELFWYLSTIMPMGRLERAVSYKDKVDHGISADVGLFTYPILMAADILVYGSDVVPVGKDQVQHLEITRDIATTFNQLFVPHFDAANPDGDKKGRGKAVLRLPRPLVQESTAVVPGTDGQKMSKSYGNVIELFSEDNIVKKQIMGIKTDSTPVEAPKAFDATPLLPLIKLFGSPADVAETERTFREGGLGYGHYKVKILDLFHATFDAARARRRELAADLPGVERVLQQGAEKARNHAAPIMDEVRKLVGTRAARRR